MLPRNISFRVDSRASSREQQILGACGSRLRTVRNSNIEVEVDDSAVSGVASKRRKDQSKDSGDPPSKKPRREISDDLDRTQTTVLLQAKRDPDHTVSQSFSCFIVVTNVKNNYFF